MNRTHAAVAGSLVFLSLAAPALGQTAVFQNKGFEQACYFCGSTAPEGFHSPGSNPNARRRFVGDGQLPALFAVGTAGALTPRTGNAVAEMRTSGSGGFVGLTTDTVNFCYCDQNCLTACTSPYPYFDPYYDWDGGDVVVSGWYMIPTDAPIEGDLIAIKLDIKLPGPQDAANWDTFSTDNTIPSINLGVPNTTNGEWRYYEQRWTRAQIHEAAEFNSSPLGPCGVPSGSCFPLPPYPNHLKITIGRYTGDGNPTSGTVFWDDLDYVQLPVETGCGSADFDGDGDTGTDLDIEAFFACLGGDCCATCGSADFDGDGDTGTDLDIEAFFRVLGGGNC